MHVKDRQVKKKKKKDMRSRKTVAGSNHWVEGTGKEVQRVDRRVKDALGKFQYLA